MAFVDFGVKSFDPKIVFAMSSNSTILSLSFDTADRELSFIVAGIDGTTGFVKVEIAMSIVTNIGATEVKLKDTETNKNAVY